MSTRSNHLKRRITATLASMTASALYASTLSAADLEAIHTFDIKPQKLESALIEFSQQAAMQVIGATDTLNNLQSKGVSGRVSNRAALTTLLENTSVAFNPVGTHSVQIVPLRARTTSQTRRDGGRIHLAQATASSTDGDRSEDQHALQSGDQRASEQQRIELEEIIVTGSHIHGATIDGPSPVVIYDRQQLDRSGASNLGEFVARLPQNVGSPVTDTAAATPDGARAVNLRGLGEGATLILVNGRRQQIGAATQAFGNQANSVNLNAIPFGAIDRVEVLTDGASAIYGSDAVGGIVNIILRKDFNGLESRSRYGNTTRQDLQELSQSFAGGFAKDALSVLVSADYFERDELLTMDRAASLAPLRASPSAEDVAGVPAVPANIFAVSGNLPGLNSSFAAVPHGQDGTSLTPASFSATQGTLNPLVPNGALYSLYTPQERETGYMRLGYAAGDNLDLFAEASITHLENRYQQPSSFNQVTVPASNPFNPFGVDVLASFYLPHSNDSVTTTDDYGATAGFDYRLSDRLRFDGYVAWSESSAHSDVSRITDAAVAAALAQTDRSTALNVFGDDLANRRNVAEQIARTVVSTDGKMTSRTVGAKMEVAVLQLPAGMMKAVVGAEHREEDLHFIYVDKATDIFRVRSEYAPRREIDSAFAEIAVPLVRDRFGVQSVDLSVAGRYDDYSDFGDTSNPQVGLTVRPFTALLLRATYGTSFIAPSFSQSFLADSVVQLPQVPQLRIFDPVLNQTYNFATLISGGNPNLEPQSADTWSAGFVFEPPQLESMRLALNWYRIDYQDKIEYLSFRNLPPFESLFPQNFVRDPANGNRIVSIRQGPVNVARVQSSGIDANLWYSWNTAIGRFDASLAATHVLYHRKQATPASPVVDAVGTVANPKEWEGGVSLFYTRGGFNVGPTIRYTHSYVSEAGVKLDATVLVSLQSSYEYLPRSAGAWFKSLRASIGLDNAFDEMPSADGSVAGFDFTEGDLRGRQYYLTLDARF